MQSKIRWMNHNTGKIFLKRTERLSSELSDIKLHRNEYVQLHFFTLHFLYDTIISVAKRALVSGYKYVRVRLCSFTISLFKDLKWKNISFTFGYFFKTSFRNTGRQKVYPLQQSIIYWCASYWGVSFKLLFTLIKTLGFTVLPLKLWSSCIKVTYPILKLRIGKSISQGTRPTQMMWPSKLCIFFKLFRLIIWQCKTIKRNVRHYHFKNADLYSN